MLGILASRDVNSDDQRKMEIAGIRLSLANLRSFRPLSERAAE